MLAAVKANGCALKHADLTGILRGNRAIALAAVTADGAALEFVASDLRRDAEVREPTRMVSTRRWFHYDRRGQRVDLTVLAKYTPQRSVGWLTLDESNVRCLLLLLTSCCLLAMSA